MFWYQQSCRKEIGGTDETLATRNFPWESGIRIDVDTRIVHPLLQICELVFEIKGNDGRIFPHRKFNEN